MKRKDRIERRMKRTLARREPTRIENLVNYALSAPPCYCRGHQDIILPVESHKEESRFVDKRNAAGQVDWDQVSCVMSNEEYGDYLLAAA